MGYLCVPAFAASLFTNLWTLAEGVGLGICTFLSLLILLGFRLRTTMAVPPGQSAVVGAGLERLRKVSESEVIAEFLRNEFYHHDFDEVREEFARIVLHPNLADANENQLRRQLLFRKRAGLWRELPEDTQWWEVRVQPRALGRIRIFPRADWRRFSQRGFSLPQMALRIREALATARDDDFLARVAELQKQLVAGEGELGCVLLIGIDEETAFTIIEGNHRMVAAVMSPAPQLEGLRFFCGSSPQMWKCCWYQTRVGNFLHYAGNLLKDLSQLRHSDVARAVPRRRFAARASSPSTPAVLPLSKTKRL
jgi:hypothetical protein